MLGTTNVLVSAVNVMLHVMLVCMSCIHVFIAVVCHGSRCVCAHTDAGGGTLGGFRKIHTPMCLCGLCVWSISMVLSRNVGCDHAHKTHKFCPWFIVGQSLFIDPIYICGDGGLN